MKKWIYILGLMGLLGYNSCTPDRYKYEEPALMDMNDIGQIKLRLNHFQLLADGKAEIEFAPLLMTKDSFEVADSRIDHSLIEYHTLEGESLPNVYSTSEASLIGKKISVYATVKNTALMSDTVSFEIIDPSPMNDCEEVTIPVVFHLIQSEGDITSYGGEIPMERIHLLLEKINNTFSGLVSRNATGVDSKIRFEPALYDPYGTLLNEPGIDRIYVSEVSDVAADQYATFITEQKAVWDYTRYLNIWLISDAFGEYSTFYSTITKQCIPRYVATENDLATCPQGLSFSVVPENWEPLPNEVGIIYKLQSLFSMTRGFGGKEENELTNCLGYYLGLLPTWGESESAIPDDYCSDTFKYYGNSNQKFNTSSHKEVGDYFFLSENVMDDPTGVHRSVSQKQALRMHWVLQHCPERAMWKSDYAFTGK